MSSTWPERRSHWGIMLAPTVSAVKRHRRLYTVSMFRRTIARAWKDRVLGLAAEAGFWQLVSIPPLLLSVLGTIGYVSALTGHDTVDRIEHSILQAAGHLLSSSTVQNTVKPTIDDVLRRGRPTVISLGFIVALWSGSTAMATYVNTITIAYGERDQRGALRSRLLALRLFIFQVISAVILLPALVLGPTVIDRFLGKYTTPWVHSAITAIYWPLAVLVALVILATLYHLSVPHRRRWRSALPGAIFALLIWVAGSWALRSYVAFVFNRTVAYGTLAAPVAVLLFLYVTALAVLLGAELNATLDLTREELLSKELATAAAEVETSPVGRVPGEMPPRPIGDADQPAGPHVGIQRIR